LGNWRLAYYSFESKQEKAIFKAGIKQFKTMTTDVLTDLCVKSSIEDFWAMDELYCQLKYGE